MFQSLTTSLKATLYERTSSPIFSSFIISWLVCNYKIVILFFSSLEPRYKIYEIELAFSKDNMVVPFFDSLYIPYFNAFFLPFVLCLFYTLLLPFIEAKLYKIWLMGQRELINVKSESEGKTTWSQAQIDILRQELQTNKFESLTLLEKNDSEIRKLKNDLDSQKSAEAKNVSQAVEIEIERSKAEIKIRDEEIFKLSNELSLLKAERDDIQLLLDIANETEKAKIQKISKEHFKSLEDLEVRVLTDFINSKSYSLTMSDYMGNFSGIQKIKVEEVISSLMKKQYISHDSSSYSTDHLVLSNSGKKYYEKLMTTLGSTR